MMITIIKENGAVVGYAENIEDAKKSVIRKFFAKESYEPKTWEHACKISNINIIYTFENIEKF